MSEKILISDGIFVDLVEYEYENINLLCAVGQLFPIILFFLEKDDI